MKIFAVGEKYKNHTPEKIAYEKQPYQKCNQNFPVERSSGFAKKNFHRERMPPKSYVRKTAVSKNEE